MEKLTLTIAECREFLSNAGFSIGQDKLSIGIRQGVFPEFARAVDMRSEDGRGNFEYVIFKKDVERFIREHGA